MIINHTKFTMHNHRQCIKKSAQAHHLKWWKIKNKPLLLVSLGGNTWGKWTYTLSLHFLEQKWKGGNSWQILSLILNNLNSIQIKRKKSITKTKITKNNLNVSNLKKNKNNKNKKIWLFIFICFYKINFWNLNFSPLYFPLKKRWEIFSLDFFPPRKHKWWINFHSLLLKIYFPTHKFTPL